MTTADRNLPTPFYAVVGAGDLAVKQVSDAVVGLRERTEAASETAQARFEETKTRLEETRGKLNALPDELPGTIESTIDDLRARFSPEEIRKIADGYVELAGSIYTSLAERGEEAVGRLWQQPLVQEGLTRAEKTYNEAVDLTEDTLGVVSHQTRAVGEQAAKFAGIVSTRVGEAGDKLDEAADKFNDAVDDAALEAGEKLDDAAAKVSEAGATAKARSATAAAKIDGAAGTVEGKARTANASPAKKIAAKKTTTPAKKTTTAKKSTPAKKTTS
ncbi:heparin-binding hemagglutinin [Gordonia sp. NPDC003425]